MHATEGRGAGCVAARLDCISGGCRHTPWGSPPSAPSRPGQADENSAGAERAAWLERELSKANSEVEALEAKNSTLERRLVQGLENAAKPGSGGGAGAACDHVREGEARGAWCRAHSSGRLASL